MRMPKYLSPSSLSKFYSNRDEFYLQYLCEHRNPKALQLDYMAAGSAFDAFVKNRIYRDVFGENSVKGTAFEFTTLFERQVEAHIRDNVLKRATDIWNQYIESGAYANLIKDIVLSPYAPQMEFRVEAEVEGVPLLGLPDLRYITTGGVHVICDFKVNGAYSKTGASPFGGYKVCWDYGSCTHGKCHKKYTPMEFRDVEINSEYLEVFCDYWADQLATYAWMLGEPVGSEQFVVRMEQLAMRPVKSRSLPRGKFVTHMNRVSKLYQLKLIEKYQTAWATIQSGHIFTDLSREDSDAKIDLLDCQAMTPKGLFPALYQEEAAPRFFKSKG